MQTNSLDSMCNGKGIVDSMDLQSRVGIVTGGSSGIGFQIANSLSLQGATVYNISRTAQSGMPKARRMSSISRDLQDRVAMDALVGSLRRNGGALDCQQCRRQLQMSGRRFS